MTRIVLTDVDGTLVTYDGTIPPSAVDAIAGARAHGHRVYLVTGRSRAEIYDDLWAIEPDGFIGGNGSYVEDAGEAIWHQTLTREQCAAVVDWLTARGCAFYLEANSGLYASATFATDAEPAIRAYAAGKGAENASTMTVADVFPHLVYGADLVRDDVNKISFVLNSYDDHLDATAAFGELTSLTWGGRGSHALFGDLGVPDVDKAHAVGVLLAHLRADRADAIAFGDATVDLPLFEACGTAVAMGNAPDEVKDAADLVTDDVHADGFAHAFARLGLLGG